MKKLLLTLTSLGFIAVLGVVLVIYALFEKPNDIETEELYLIEYGTSVPRLAQDLTDKGFIATPLVFKLAYRLQGVMLKAGEYQIPPHASTGDILALFQSGKTYQRRITIPEGLTVRQIVALLDTAEGLTGEVETLPTEGVLLPETYSYSKGDSKTSLLKRMEQAHHNILNRLWENKDSALPYKTPEEAVIMASIVERETGVAAERAKVAGVFINRLRLGMMLQSDPTIIYPLSNKLGVLDRPLYRKDWQYDSPYNTYKITGLPPTPIANPGRASLEAAFNPEQHEYLYFVADGTSGHAFARTLEEHNRNVASWRRIKKERGIQ